MARLLIVDDDSLIRDLLVATLEFGDHQIDQAADGEAAVSSFVDRPADVVILDLDLPGLSGPEVLQRLRAAGEPRVVVLTASGRAREAQLRAAGAVGYLTKPFSPLELIGAIEAALHG